MLVSGDRVRGSWASNDSLWEVVQFRAPNHSFVWQFFPPLPTLLAGLGEYISTEFLIVTVPGAGCRSQGCRGYLRTQLKARISLGANTHFHGHLPQARLLAMNLTRYQTFDIMPFACLFVFSPLI